jgi:hypothetical protein
MLYGLYVHYVIMFMSHEQWFLLNAVHYLVAFMLHVQRKNMNELS